MSDPQNPDIPPPPRAYDPAPPPAYDAAPPPASQPTYSSAQPTYSSAPPAQYGAPADAPVPGKTLGIVAFILSFFVQLVALILGIVALVQSRRAGHKNGWAVAAIIISIVLMILGIIIAIAVVVPLLTFSQDALAACQAVDFTGTVDVRGIQVDCANIR